MRGSVAGDGEVGLGTAGHAGAGSVLEVEIGDVVDLPLAVLDSAAAAPFRRRRAPGSRRSRTC